MANGAVLKTQVRVREITVGRGGLAEGVIYYDDQGNVHEQKARIVVLACNGIGTPRLLLNSKSPVFPDGLANSSGLVGKNLMLHPTSMVTGVFDEELEGHKGPIGCAILSHEFYETDLSRGFVRGYQMQAGRHSGPLHTALEGVSGPAAPWGNLHHRVFAERLGRTITIGVTADDLPELHNRITLDPHLSDGDGIPSPKVTYSVSENSRKMLDHGIDRASEALEAAGAKDVLAGPLMRSAGWHLMGTAKMGTRRDTSVVDQWGRCHDVQNLYIVDGSVLVTGGAVNPTSTIQALALYIADHFNRNARNILS